MAHPDTGRGKPRGHAGSTIALIRGESSRAVLATTAAALRRAPSFARSYVARRDQRLWAFGNVHGFRDSPRYLAEHVLHSQPDIRPVWIAHSADEAEAARACGLEAVAHASRDGRRLQRRAGASFFTHGFLDLDLDLVVGGFLVYLWHGKSLKVVGLDAAARVGRRRSLAVRAAAAISSWFKRRSFKMVGLYVASSAHEKERFLTAFAAPPERVHVLGSARFDVIRGGPAYERVIGGADLRATLGLAADDRVVLWLPTHRTEYGGDAPWLPALDASLVEHALAGSPVVLLVKPHPNADFDVYRQRLPDHPRIRLLDDSHVDVNALLHVSDALVTDYSSVVFDWAILGRPVHFFAPDLDTYSEGRGLYEPYETLSDGRHHRDWPSLLAELAAESAGPAGPGAEGGESVGLQLARRVADYCRNNVEPDTCARIVAAVRERVIDRGHGG